GLRSDSVAPNRQGGIRSARCVHVGQQPVGQPAGVRQGHEVPARDLVDADLQPLARDARLELAREEAVLCPDDDVGRDLAPGVEAARLVEDDLRLGARMGRALASDVLGDVVQEVRRRVELGAVPAARRGLDPRLARTRAVPPGAGGLAGHRDHRVDEDEGAERRGGEAGADEGRREAAEGLGDQGHVGAGADGVEDDAGVGVEPGARVVGGEIDREDLVSGRFEERSDAMPVPRVAASPGDENEGRHAPKPGTAARRFRGLPAASRRESRRSGRSLAEKQPTASARRGWYASIPMDLSPAVRVPPGPSSWPLVGNIPDIRAAGGVLPYFDRLWKAHGDTCRFKMFGTNSVLVTHPESLKQVLSTRRDRYVKGKIYDSPRGLLGDNLVTLDGERWKSRRALAQPAFHRQSLAKLTAIMARSGASVLDELAARVSGAALEVDAHREMVKLTLDVVIAALFGEDLLRGADVSYELLGAALEVMSDRGNGIPLP